MLAAKKNLNFKIDVSPDMPPGHGDERKLNQVLLNPVGNAIKFTDAGEVAIKVAPANVSFSVAVHDTGPGIPLADQERPFEEFQQAANSITRTGVRSSASDISSHIQSLADYITDTSDSSFRKRQLSCRHHHQDRQRSSQQPDR
jgi:light-regulated signal transduction histidine kinase (bacteriophytochrome)